MRTRRSVVWITAAVGIVGSMAAPATHASATRPVPDSLRSCASPGPGQAACNAVRRQSVTTGRVRAASSAGSVVAGYGPAALDAAYRLPSATAGAGQTVAVVDAYSDPTAARDLATYRSHFGLPACTSTGGCLRIVGQAGTSRLPAIDGGWAEEISLDLDMVSAICPRCRILLVEASSASLVDLGTAVDEAVRLGATEVTNSYGGPVSADDALYDARYYRHPGVAVVASSGDDGYGVEYPASSPYVIAVGGTTLSQDGSGAYRQTAWGGAGSGCSSVDARPAWQAQLAATSRTCARRAVADVSAVADPATGVAVYDTTSYGGWSGWMVFGGTSVASPIVAATFALAGNAARAGLGASYLYSHASSLADVTSGRNGTCGTSLCTAGAGWDGPTGLGTPSGTGAF